MKSTTLILGLWLLFSMSTVLYVHADNSAYQTAKIVAVEKLESSASGGGTDAPTAPNQNRFNMSIQLDDSVYVCRVKTTSDMDLDWAVNKEVQVQKKGGVMYMKRSSGKVVKFSIVSSGKPQ